MPGPQGALHRCRPPLPVVSSARLRPRYRYRSCDSHGRLCVDIGRSAWHGLDEISSVSCRPKPLLSLRLRAVPAWRGCTRDGRRGGARMSSYTVRPTATRHKTSRRLASSRELSVCWNDHRSHHSARAAPPANPAGARPLAQPLSGACCGSRTPSRRRRSSGSTSSGRA